MFGSDILIGIKKDKSVSFGLPPLGHIESCMLLREWEYSLLSESLRETLESSHLIEYSDLEIISLHWSIWEVKIDPRTFPFWYKQTLKSLET